MKNFWILISVATLIGATQALALSADLKSPPQHDYSCHSADYPLPQGSQLTIHLASRESTGSATWTLSPGSDSSMGLGTSGDYFLHSALNENSAPVIYLNWYAGAGSDYAKMANTLVIYDLEGNYQNNKTLFVGAIQWLPNGDKLETHHIFTCE